LAKKFGLWEKNSAAKGKPQNAEINIKNTPK
jgi:hypothetical protein